VFKKNDAGNAVTEAKQRSLTPPPVDFT